jgi:hypothetical protein
MAKQIVKSATLKPKSKKNKEIRVTIEEISNGFLVIKNIEWEDKDGYHYETIKTYVAENPLEENKPLADVFK